MQFNPTSFTDNYGLYVIIETVPGVAFLENNFRVVGIAKSRKTAEKYSGPNRIIKGPVTMLDGDVFPVRTQNPSDPKFPYDVYYEKPEVPEFHKTTEPAKVIFPQFTPNPSFPFPFEQNPANTNLPAAYPTQNPNILNQPPFFNQGLTLKPPAQNNFNSNKDSNKMDID